MNYRTQSTLGNPPQPHSEAAGATLGHRSPHHFHIPVMGTGFTIDSPLRVARYGISTVVSLGDDHLIEQMRAVHTRKVGREFVPIDSREPEARVRRIRAYLNMINEQVSDQISATRSASFESPGDLTRYFELLPDCPIKETYKAMVACSDEKEKAELQAQLRQQVAAGRIDVNIMTKIDTTFYHDGTDGPPETGVAMSALRGYATSDLCSRVVLSAGLNKRLFAYMADFEDFFPHDGQPPRKGITLKVSDYRSALLQGRLFARKGLWVSEFRVESGLNCGGHAFATLGELMGPILEEFSSKREELTQQLHEIYTKGLAKTDRKPWGGEKIELTAQGGVGTVDEHNFLIDRYGLNAVGWGTPFLLVPEVTNVDEAHLQKLVAADANDVRLSDASPLGVPFWKLYNSASDDNRRKHIDRGRPGSACPKRFLISDSEFTEAPICRASRKYQKLKLSQIADAKLPEQEAKLAAEQVVGKSCLCADLGSAAQIKNGLKPSGYTAVCAGPGIVDFNRILTLEDLVNHIYGRCSVGDFSNRPHMFVKELSLYVAYLKDQIERRTNGLADQPEKYLVDFRDNLLKGIEYYRELASGWTNRMGESFQTALSSYEEQLATLLDEVCTGMTDSVALAGRQTG